MSKVISPLQLVQTELSKYEKALSKSKQNFDLGKISFEEHKQHWVNLKPIIKQYREAVLKLCETSEKYLKNIPAECYSCGHQNSESCNTCRVLNPQFDGV